MTVKSEELLENELLLKGPTTAFDLRVTHEQFMVPDTWLPCFLHDFRIIQQKSKLQLAMAILKIITKQPTYI
jgi:hypothetical protein